MVSEFKIRREVRQIDASDEPPVAKARHFLALSRATRKAALQLSELAFRLFRQGDKEGSKRFARAAALRLRLAETVRGKARHALHENDHKVGYDLEAPKLAVPSWEREEEEETAGVR